MHANLEKGSTEAPVEQHIPSNDNAVRDNAAQHIFAKTTAGRTIQVGITGDCDTVDDIKAVCKKAEILPARHRLVFAGKELKDGNLLADYNIRKGSTVRVVMPYLRGGSKDDNINVANPMLDEVEDEDNVVEDVDQLAERAERLEKHNARAEEADGVIEDEVANRVAEFAGDQEADVPSASMQGSEELPAGGCALLEGTGTLEGVLYVCESCHSLPFSFSYVRSASISLHGGGRRCDLHQPSLTNHARRSYRRRANPDACDRGRRRLARGLARVDWQL